MVDDVIPYQRKRDSPSDRTVLEVAAAVGCAQVTREGKQRCTRQPWWGSFKLFLFAEEYLL